jgi:2-polyprenyl-6-methoxyphenol hydroxylase-like FAD-dependent oxidoreductase
MRWGVLGMGDAGELLSTCIQHSSFLFFVRNPNPAGTVVTRLQPGLSAASSPSRPGPAAAAATPLTVTSGSAAQGRELVIGWAELERLLIDSLPLDAIEWNAAVTEIREDGEGRVRLALGGGQRGVVSAEVLVAADGALSAVCAACCPDEQRAEFQVCLGWLIGPLLPALPTTSNHHPTTHVQTPKNSTIPGHRPLDRPPCGRPAGHRPDGL